ncbi:MAG: deoxyribodipyrimidine photo-lyase [Pedobacter sp.]|nr:deoxyribodipyrimidine photo-lyase [Pedobacter sp.]
MKKPESQTKPRHLLWLRADLRSTDNTALLAACSDKAAEVACVYAITPAQWTKHDVAGVRVDFELRSLSALKTTLEALNIPLLLLHSPDFDSLPAEMAKLASQHDITTVFANRQYEINEVARDEKTAAALAKADIDLQLFHDQCIVPPGKVLKPDGTAYSVFTPFKRNWQTVAGPLSRPQPAPSRRQSAFTKSDSIPAVISNHSSHVDAGVALEWWPAGEEVALQRLADFVRDDLAHYKDRRDFPAQAGVSRLSPYLAIGALSARQCLNAALNHQASYQRRHHESPGHDQWIAELAWRDFYKHVLVAWPRVCRHRPFRLETEPVPWRHDEKDFLAWCEGRTGFPIVDAAMRQLQKTGWMHNRLRMVVAMFLTKDLFIDWRWGEKFFMQHLIDGDLSANNGGWQWSASTGNDAAPYFRIFNPASQSRKFDAEGHFIREYVPELRDLPSRDIHEPHAKGQASLFSVYPAPIVDHGLARERVLQSFKGLKGLQITE